jgi:hypothetical protein
MGAAIAGDLGFPQGSGRAHIWEGEFTYNFERMSMFGSLIRPYLAGGAGALVAKVKNPEVFVLNVNRSEIICDNCPRFTANDVLEDGDTFFTFSYGGGIKLHRLWGPVGFFGDLRGRTIPNFFGHGTNWPEVSAGLTFSWGER